MAEEDALGMKACLGTDLYIISPLFLPTCDLGQLSWSEHYLPHLSNETYYPPCGAVGKNNETVYEKCQAPWMPACLSSHTSLYFNIANGLH